MAIVCEGNYNTAMRTFQFKDAVEKRTYDYRFDDKGGFQSIAAGMHWSPTDKLSIINEGRFYEKNLKKEFQECINNLNQRKELCEQAVKQKPSLFSILKNAHK